MTSKVSQMLQSFGGQKHLYSIIGVSFDFFNMGLSVKAVFCNTLPKFEPELLEKDIWNVVVQCR